MKANQLYLFKEGKSHIRISAGKIHVRAHRRRNGSYVKEHWRNRPSRRFENPRRFSPADEQLSFVEADEPVEEQAADD